MPTLIALGLVAWWASRQKAPHLPQSAGAVGLLVLGVALYAVATLLRGERWERILRRAGIRTRRADAYGLVTVGYMGNNVLPARGGELLRVFLLAPRTGASKRLILGTVLAERLLDALALALMFVALAYGLLRGVSLPSSHPVLIAAVIAAIVAAAVAAFVVARRRGLVGKLIEFVRPLSGPLRDLASWHGLALLVLSVAIWAIEASVYLAVAHSVGLGMTVLGALYVVAFTNLFALIPAAPGYIGTFDAAVIFAVKAIGLAGSAVSYLLLLRFVLFIPITVAGLVVMVARYGGWARFRAARVEAEAAEAAS